MKRAVLLEVTVKKKRSKRKKKKEQKGKERKGKKRERERKKPSPGLVQMLCVALNLLNCACVVKC